MAAPAIDLSKPLTKKARTDPRFGLALVANPTFRTVAVSALPDSHVAHVLRTFGAEAVSALTVADVGMLRVRMTLNRWQHAVCMACLRKGTVTACQSCLITFYCNDSCRAKHAEAHAQVCGKRDAPWDPDDPLSPALLPEGGAEGKGNEGKDTAVHLDGKTGKAVAGKDKGKDKGKEKGKDADEKKSKGKDKDKGKDKGKPGGSASGVRERLQERLRERGKVRLDGVAGDVAAKIRAGTLHELSPTATAAALADAMRRMGLRTKPASTDGTGSGAGGAGGAGAGGAGGVATAETKARSRAIYGFLEALQAENPGIDMMTQHNVLADAFRLSEPHARAMLVQWVTTRACAAASSSPMGLGGASSVGTATAAGDAKVKGKD